MPATTNPVTVADPKADAGKKDDGGKKTFDAEYVKKLRNEAAENRIKAKEAKEERDQFKTELGTVKERLDAFTDGIAALSGKKTAEDEDPVQAQLAAMTAKQQAILDRLDSRDKAATAAEGQAKKIAIDADIGNAALIEGLAEGVMPEHILALIDKTGIKFDAESQTVEGTDEALKTLKESATYLFDEAKAKAPQVMPGGTPRGRGAPHEKTVAEKVLDRVAGKAGQGMLNVNERTYGSPMGDKDGRGQYEGL